jgi:hypothetical protein
VRTGSQGEEAAITGDMPYHPCQAMRPEWVANAAYDTQQSTATRRAFHARYADSPVLVIGAHFATPTAGRLVRDGDARRFDVAWASGCWITSHGRARRGEAA